VYLQGQEVVSQGDTMHKQLTACGRNNFKLGGGWRYSPWKMLQDFCKDFTAYRKTYCNMLYISLLQSCNSTSLTSCKFQTGRY